MSSSVVEQRSDHVSAILNPSFTASQIPPPNSSHSHSSSRPFFDSSHLSAPGPLSPRRPNLTYDISDIAGSRPISRAQKLAQNPRNPLDPEYKLPSYDPKPEPPPKFLRDPLDLSDLPGSSPRKQRIRNQTQHSLNVADINQKPRAQPSHSASASSSIVPDRHFNVSDITARNQWNNPVFSSNRVTNPLEPVYKIAVESQMSPRQLQHWISQSRSGTSSAEVREVMEFGYVEGSKSKPPKSHKPRKPSEEYALKADDINVVSQREQMWKNSLNSHSPHSRALDSSDIAGTASDPVRMGKGLNTGRKVDFSDPQYQWNTQAGVVHVDRHILDNLKLYDAEQEQNENGESETAAQTSSDAALAGSGITPTVPLVTAEYANSIISKWRQQPPFPDPSAAGSAASTFRFHYNPGNGKPVLASELEQYNLRMKEQIARLTRENELARQNLFQHQQQHSVAQGVKEAVKERRKSIEMEKEKSKLQSEGQQKQQQQEKSRPQTATARQATPEVQVQITPAALPVSQPMQAAAVAQSSRPASAVAVTAASRPTVQAGSAPLSARFMYGLHPATASALYGTNREAQLLAAHRDPRNTRTIQAGRPWLPTSEQVKQAKKKAVRQKKQHLRPQTARFAPPVFIPLEIKVDSDSELEFSDAEPAEAAPEVPENAWVRPVNVPVVPSLAVPETPFTRPQTSYAPQRNFLQVHIDRSMPPSGAQTPIAPTRPATARYRQSITSPGSRTERLSQTGFSSRPSTSLAATPRWSIASPRSVASTTLGRTPEIGNTRPSSATLEARHDAWLSFSPAHDPRGGTLFDFDRRLENAQLSKREVVRISDEDRMAVLALH